MNYLRELDEKRPQIPPVDLGTDAGAPQRQRSSGAADSSTPALTEGDSSGDPYLKRSPDSCKHYRARPVD